MAIINGVAAQYLAREYGGLFDLKTTRKTLGVTKAEILGPDPERVWVHMMNLSVNQINLGYDFELSATQSFLLTPSGGQFSVTTRDDFVIPNQQFVGFASAASSVLFVAYIRRVSVVSEQEQ